VVWDTTAPRHLAVVNRIEILVTVTGLLAPRAVLDPADPSGDDLLARQPSTISEIACAEQRFLARHRQSRRLDDLAISERLRKLRVDPDTRVLDLTEQEADDAATFASSQFADRVGLLDGLGRGECAVLAVAASRELTAGIDDGAARKVASFIGVCVFTTEDLLRTAVARLLVSKAEAEGIHQSLLDQGFRGSASLY
jgi:hypothetical protein